MNGDRFMENKNDFSSDGFYTKKSDEIIQDKAEPSDNSYYSSSYSSYTPNYNNGNNYYTAPKKLKKKYGAGVVVLSAVLAAVIGAASAMIAMPYIFKAQNTDNGTVLTPNNVSINIDETAESVVEAVATKVTPSVVGIRTTTSVISFFGGGNEQTGEGSGVVYSSDGYIITNYHVIADAISSNGSKIEVYLDKETDEPYTAAVVGYNISTDLAVIKINVKGLTAAEIGDADSLKVGQYVITVGNPGGLEFMDSVTYGVISGLDRVVSSNSDVELIQTDAAINPGNSGGALVNVKGQLVGINSSKIVSEEYEGMGFAIPIDKVIEVCDDIISKENDPEPYVGITVSEKYSSQVLSFYGYPSGAVVLSVADGSPADIAGIRRGDIVTEFDGTKISEYEMLDQLIEQCSPGEKVEAKIYRGGNYYTTTVTIGSNN